MKYILVLFLFTSIVSSDSIYTAIPSKARGLSKTIIKEQQAVLPRIKINSYFNALIEQESCISIKHRRCFDPKSRLYHTRKNGEKEEGAGLLQLTRVWNRQGRVRMDTLTGLVKKYPLSLKGLSWKTVYKRGDLQIKAAFLLWRDNFRRIKKRYGGHMDLYNLVAFTDAAYNGGYGGLSKDVRLCLRTKGCDSTKWFGNVEKTCTKSKRKLYGNRDACDINRDHVRKIMNVRILKYHYLYN